MAGDLEPSPAQLGDTVTNWADVRGSLDTDTPVRDSEGVEWRRTNGLLIDTLYRWVGDEILTRTFASSERITMDRPPRFMDNPKACGAPAESRWGYLPCGCCNDGYGRHVR